jgi:hypothetical protein
MQSVRQPRERGARCLDAVNRGRRHADPCATRGAPLCWSGHLTRGAHEIAPSCGPAYDPSGDRARITAELREIRVLVRPLPIVCRISAHPSPHRMWRSNRPCVLSRSVPASSSCRHRRGRGGEHRWRRGWGWCGQGLGRTHLAR